MSFEILQETDPLNTVIKVIGVGGGGGNAVEHMISQGSKGVEFIAANTDHQALQRSRAHVTIQLGNTGLGAGANPEVGAEAARAKRDVIEDAIRGSHLLFITAGMGGGTGTGAAPVIAEIAKELGILTVAVVTRPFSFEGSRRMRVAQEGIDRLRDKVDSMLVILNEKLEDVDPDATMKECYEMSNDVLYKACVGIADIIHTPGYINLDFEDLKTVMTIRGSAIIGLASRSGPDRAVEAAKAAISCPLLEGRNLEGAQGLLVYFSGDESVTMSEMKRAMAVLQNFISKQAQVIWGSAIVPEMGDEVRVTLVATGLDETPSDSKGPSFGMGAAPVGLKPLDELTRPAAAPSFARPAAPAQAPVTAPAATPAPAAAPAADPQPAADPVEPAPEAAAEGGEVPGEAAEASAEPAPEAAPAAPAPASERAPSSFFERDDEPGVQGIKIPTFLR